MTTPIIILIVLTILYLIVKRFWTTSSSINHQPDRYIPEGDRTIEEIMGGRPFHEIKEELDAIKHEDRTGNEILVLWGITKWDEENPPSSI